MRILLITFFLCLYTSSIFAIDLEKAVKMLEAVGDFETAEPVAFKLTQKKKEHYYRIEFLNKYPASEFAEIVYLQTWKDVKDSGNMAKLQSFVKVMPGGKYSLEALDRLFDLYQKEDTILGYQYYIKEFPNSPQAVRALEGIFRLAFERAEKHAGKLNSVKFFDEYIRTFPTSPHLEEISRKAEKMEYQAIDETLESFSIGNLFSSRQRQKETIARKLYNEMRSWQRKNELLIAQRKYSLIRKEIFIDTKAYTEMMDREETMSFRKTVASFQKQTTQKLDDLNQLYRQESARIIDTIRDQARLTRTTITDEGRKIRSSIADEGRMTRSVIGEQGRKTRNDIQYMTSRISDLSYEKGRLADAIDQQTDRMMDEARRASYEQERMFNKSREEARRQSSRNRHCAEVLAKNGKYPLFSGCP
ncbi:hypothetical protein QUF76_08885 [Desulfobacterales bacterium HSG16]|nr:hypothetical protein [Desulfobacterales bacterium HSG16]